MNKWLHYFRGERVGLSAGIVSPSLLSPRTSVISIQNTVQLLDVSFWQGTIDFQKMKSAGGSGVIIRAGQHTWPDNRFVENWSKSKGVIPRGSYWFYDSRSTPKSQAALWWAQIKNDVGELFHVADFEEGYGGAYGSKAHFKEFLTEFQRLSSLPSNRIAVYTGYYWWNSRVGNDPWFAQFPLWLAWYNTNQADVRVPLPWTQLHLWQYSSTGSGSKFGVSSSNIDLNWWHGNLNSYNTYFNLGQTTPPPSSDAPQHVRRFNSDVWITDVDPKSVVISKLANANSLERTSSAAVRYGASLAINGDGWKLSGLPKYPLSLASSKGDFYQKSQMDFRPFLEISKSGIAKIGHSVLKDPWNVVSGTRYVVQGNIIPPNLFQNVSPYSDLHPRTAVGVTASGRLVMVVVDGRRNGSLGVKLSELGSIMMEFGCVDAIELDGGGSSTMWHKGNILNTPSDGAERYVVNHLLVIDGGNMVYGKAKEKLGKTVTIRSTPRVETWNGVGSITAGQTVNFVAIVDDLDNAVNKWLKLGDGQYAAYIYPPNGLRFDILSTPTPDPEPDPEPQPEPELPTIRFTVDGGEKYHSIIVELKPK